MINISVIIPLYNKEESVVNTLKSVLEQTYSVAEILVVDDGSVDDGVKRIRELDNDKIKIIQQKNKGVCAARNNGIIQASSAYLAFLDADDLWDKDYLKEQVALIKDFPEAAMWGLNFASLKNTKQESLNTGLPEGFRNYVYNYFTMNRVSDLFCSSSVIIKKTAFDKAGMFDERIKYSEDLDMWYRIILNFPVAFSDRIMVYYRLDAENRALNRKRHLKDFLPYYVSKYDEYCDANPTFSYFIHTFSAANIRTYYFGPGREYKDAKVAVKGLRYGDIHKKYSLWYKTPYLLGLFFYKITLLRQKIRS